MDFKMDAREYNFAWLFICSNFTPESLSPIPTANLIKKTDWCNQKDINKVAWRS
jgi:hypothetical protein